MADILPALPGPLAEYLQEPRLVQIATVEAQTGAPFVNVITWVLASGPDRIRLMGDSRTLFLRNIRADGRIALNVLGAGSAWTIYGQARILTEQAPGFPFPLALVQVEALRVVESLFQGARLSQPPCWEVTAEAAQAARLDQRVFACMREFQPQQNPA